MDCLCDNVYPSVTKLCAHTHIHTDLQCIQHFRCVINQQEAIYDFTEKSLIYLKSTLKLMEAGWLSQEQIGSIWLFSWPQVPWGEAAARDTSTREVPANIHSIAKLLLCHSLPKHGVYITTPEECRQKPYAHPLTKYL